MPTEEQIADTYLRYFALKREEDFWAFDEINQLVENDAVIGWRVTSLLISKATSDEALAYVAAGPLEDLLKIHGLAVIDEVARVARGEMRLQRALSGVWIGRHAPVWDRWFALMKEFGFASGRRGAL